MMQGSSSADAAKSAKRVILAWFHMHPTEQAGSNSSQHFEATQLHVNIEVRGRSKSSSKIQCIETNRFGSFVVVQRCCSSFDVCATRETDVRLSPTLEVLGLLALDVSNFLSLSYTFLPQNIIISKHCFLTSFIASLSSSLHSIPPLNISSRFRAFRHCRRAPVSVDRRSLPAQLLHPIDSKLSICSSRCLAPSSPPRQLPLRTSLLPLSQTCLPRMVMPLLLSRLRMVCLATSCPL